MANAANPQQKGFNMPIVPHNHRQYYKEINALLKKHRMSHIDFSEVTGIEIGRVKNIMRGAVDWKLSEIYKVIDLFQKTDRDIPLLFPRNKIMSELPDPKHDWRYHI